MKLLKTSDELLSHMKIKGIKFDIVKEEDAKIFLQNNNYYMKLASYRANYDKCKSNGEYINLDFAYLQEFIDGRVIKNREYFKKNECIKTAYTFVKKVIDYMNESC